MTIKDLYNALEKAIDSGEATVETNVYVYLDDYNEHYDGIKAYVDNDDDFIIEI